MSSSEKESKPQEPIDLTAPQQINTQVKQNPPPFAPTSLPDQQTLLFLQLQSLESSINSKFTELLGLLQNHDKATKQILKSHQNSVKQSVRTQLERSHVETRKYVDEAMMVSAGHVVDMLDNRIKERVDEGIKSMMRADGDGGWGSCW